MSRHLNKSQIHKQTNIQTNRLILWLFMTLYDCVWLCMTMYVYVWLCMTVYDYVLLVGLCMKPKNATKKKIFNNPKTSKIKKNNEKGKKLNPPASISTLCLFLFEENMHNVLAWIWSDTSELFPWPCCVLSHCSSQFLHRSHPGINTCSLCTSFSVQNTHLLGTISYGC